MILPNNRDSQHLMHRIPPGSEGAEIGKSVVLQDNFLIVVYPD